MLKQLMLFFSPAEMLIFNSLFENRAAAKGERLISISSADFKNLRQALIEAEITRPAEEFVNGFIEEMINCGLLVRVRAKSETAPIGELRATVQKDEIAGPNYIVERGVFQIAVPLKLKATALSPVVPEETRPSAAVQVAESQQFDKRLTALELFVEEQNKDLEEMARLLRECFDAIKIKTASAPKAVLRPTVQRMIDSAEFMAFSKIDKLLMFILLSPFADKWFLQRELLELISVHSGRKVFGENYQSILCPYFSRYYNLFKKRDIGDKEQEAKNLPLQTRFAYRLSEQGIARAREDLEILAKTTGINWEGLESGAVARQEEPPAVLRDEKAAPITQSALTADSEIALLGDIVNDKIFNEMTRTDKLLILVRVSPLAYRWFLSRELKEFIRTVPNIQKSQQGLFEFAVNELLPPSVKRGYFSKKKLVEPDIKGKRVFSMCNVQYYLIQKGRERANELLKLFRREKE